MDLYNFNPPNQTIKIGNACHELRAFSIKMLVLVQKEFGNFDKFQEALSIGSGSIFKEDFANVISWLSFALLIDKTQFKNLNDFRIRFIDQKQEIYHENIVSLFNTIKDSQPILKAESATPKKKANSDQDYFSRSYAMISRENGISINAFYDLTLRQINQLQEDFIKLKNDDLEFDAKIHGVKLLKPHDKRPNSEINFSKEDDNVLTNFAAKRMEQIRKEANGLAAQKTDIQI